MGHLERYNGLVDKFSYNVDFVTVYISEAHPSDGWRFYSNAYDIKNHKTFDERMFAAAMLQKAGIKGTLVVDTFSNDVSKAFAALPERLYLNENGVVTFASKKFPLGYAKAMEAIEKIFQARYS